MLVLLFHVLFFFFGLVVVGIIVGPRNLDSKYGQNQVRDIFVVVVSVLVIFVLVFEVVVVAVDPRNLPLKSGQNGVIYI